MSVYAEYDLRPLSALQHLLFCERQCALIHVEGVWADNPLTVEGTHLHRKVDAGAEDARGDLRIARGVPLRSLRLGLSGKADAVEFRRVEQGGAPAFGEDRGLWQAFPVEYKRGRPKRGPEDRVQLCAQGLCLEEMLGAPVPAGALFYGSTRRRVEVPFTPALRGEVERAAVRLHELVRAGATPPARREPKCERCSLLHLCLPDAASGRSAAAYLRRALRADAFHDGSPAAGDST